MKAKIVLDGARANGLRLIGDGFIGYRFVPRSDLAEEADALLYSCFEQIDDPDISRFYHENCEGPYDPDLWKYSQETP